MGGKVLLKVEVFFLVFFCLSFVLEFFQRPMLKEKPALEAIWSYIPLPVLGERWVPVFE